MKDVKDTEEGGEEVDPQNLIGKRLFVKALLRFENILVSGSCISLQVKTEEVNFQKVEGIQKKERIMSNAVAAPKK